MFFKTDFRKTDYWLGISLYVIRRFLQHINMYTYRTNNKIIKTIKLHLRKNRKNIIIIIYLYTAYLDYETFVCPTLRSRKYILQKYTLIILPLRISNG